MKMENKNVLSDTEEKILAILMKSDEDMTLEEVTEQARLRYGKLWKIQTTATFLTRMQKKGYISVYRVGRYSHYHPLVEKDDFKMSTVSENINYFDKGSISAFVCGLFDNVKLTEEDKEKIRKKIDELE